MIMKTPVLLAPEKQLLWKKLVDSLKINGLQL